MNKLWNNNKVIEEIKLIPNYEIVLPLNVNKKKDKINIRCLTCNTIFPVTCDHFFSATAPTRCLFCKNGERWSIDRLLREFSLMPDNIEYELVDYDTNIYSRSKLRIKCMKCSTVFTTTPMRFFNRHQRCGKCKESLGEKFIRLFLDEHNIQYIRQKKFKDCRSKNVLPFDYYIPKYSTLIEFQGYQHFLIGGQFKITERDLEEIKVRDNIKRQYALVNGYNYLIIEYHEIKWIYHILKAYFSNIINLEEICLQTNKI